LHYDNVQFHRHRHEIGLQLQTVQEGKSVREIDNEMGLSPSHEAPSFFTISPEMWNRTARLTQHYMFILSCTFNSAKRTFKALPLTPTLTTEHDSESLQPGFHNLSLLHKMHFNIIHPFQINQPTRCNNFSSLLLDVYLQLNMFRASSRPSSGAQQLQ
jgi:hypothetical protein